MKLDKEMLRREYAMKWKEQSMVDYCIKQVSNIAELPNGEIIPIEKRSIETRFCYGESGYDMDDALKMVRHAQTSEDYFRKENMAYYDEAIRRLNDGNYRLIVYQQYTNQPDECHLYNFRIVRLCDVDEVCQERYAMEKGRTATKRETQILLEALKEAREKHAKKVETYLTRYGLTKVHAWTYWRDA